MKERWQQLNPNEQRTVISGAIALGLIFGYFFLYSPLTSKITELQQETAQQQALLSWMEPAAKHIQSLRSIQVPKTGTSTLALLPLIEQSLKGADLNKQVVELNQTEAHKVRIKFKQVSFDQLVLWLGNLWKNNSIDAEQLSVTPGQTPGIVEATVVVSPASNLLATAMQVTPG